MEEGAKENRPARCFGECCGLSTMKGNKEEWEAARQNSEEERTRASKEVQKRVRGTE